MFTEFIIIISSIVFGYLLAQIWAHLKFRKKNIPVNPLPVDIPEIAEEQRKTIELYIKEWEVIIKSQMHFNDLIIRFRSFTLTGFIAFIGATVAVQKITPLKIDDFLLIISIIITLWITAFIIDFFYYHRLLLGAVSQAMKFDNSQKLKEYGFFGLSSCISDYVHPPASKLLVIIYYLFPLLMISLLYYFRFF
jgi:hypothetical protein